MKKNTIIRHTQRDADLAYANGVVNKGLCEVEHSIRWKRMIVSQKKSQQVCGHVLKLPGSETKTDI